MIQTLIGIVVGSTLGTLWVFYGVDRARRDGHTFFSDHRR